MLYNVHEQLIRTVRGENIFKAAPIQQISEFKPLYKAGGIDLSLQGTFVLVTLSIYIHY